MNLYEFEGKHFFEQSGIAIPKGKTIVRGQDPNKVWDDLGVSEVVVKAQVLSGKRGKGGGILFATSTKELESAVSSLFGMELQGQYVAAVRIEEKLAIAEEHYLSISYDTHTKQPVLVYSASGGVDIEAVSDEQMQKTALDVRVERIGVDAPYAQELWSCFLQNDCRVAEINPLVKTSEGKWVAADAKIAVDDDAFFRHEEWAELEPRTMMGRPPTDREILAQTIDAGEKYYQGTAGKYIEMDGDIGLILNGGGASIANMDALFQEGLRPANYTEYSGNPPREKVYELAKIVMSKPGLRGLWMCGVVSNFTNMKDTFLGIIDALDEVKPRYPIVVRRDGPDSAAAIELTRACADRNHLNMRLFDKNTSMGDTAQVLASMLHT